MMNSKKLLVRWKVVEIYDPLRWNDDNTLSPYEKDCPEFPFFITEQEAIDEMLKVENKKLLNPFTEYRIVRFFKVTD